jgi:hypothetical protein
MVFVLNFMLSSCPEIAGDKDSDAGRSNQGDIEFMRGCMTDNPRQRRKRYDQMRRARRYFCR